MAGTRLIVHADDLGLSRHINDGILEAHRRGILTSTSLVASGNAFEHAIGLVRATPSLDIGIHLTLTEERPALDPGEIPSLVGPDGRFHRNIGSFVTRYLTRRVSLDDVRRELSAQIVKVLEEGIRVTHLDGHQHVHMLRGVRRVVEELAKQHGIYAVRLPRERVQPYMFRDANCWRRLAPMLALNAFCVAAGATTLKRPDSFIGFFFGGRLDRKNLETLLHHLPTRSTCELMCHPGSGDDGSYAHWRYRWREELDALTDPEIRNYVRANAIELVSYADLRVA